MMLLNADRSGSADCAPAFARALSADGWVVVPPGIYKILSWINVGSHQLVKFLPGAKLLLGADGFGGINLVGDDSTIEGVEIDCANRICYEGVYVRGGHNRVKDCYIHHAAGDSNAMIPGSGLKGHGVLIDGTVSASTRNKVEGCRMEFLNGACVYQHTASFTSIIHNRHMSDAWWGVVNYASVAPLVEGNYIWRIQTEGVTVDGGSTRARVIGNFLYQCCMDTTVAPADACISVDKSDRAIISLNSIENSIKSGIRTANKEGSANYLIITDNQITDCTGSGIHLHTEPPNGGAAGGSSSCCRASGNMIRGANLTAGLRFDVGCDNNDFRGNMLNGLPVVDDGLGNTY